MRSMRQHHPGRKRDFDFDAPAPPRTHTQLQSPPVSAAPPPPPPAPFSQYSRRRKSKAVSESLCTAARLETLWRPLLSPGSPPGHALFGGHSPWEPPQSRGV
jgi:hypothetical protein